jgi:hypothetical protein
MPSEERDRRRWQSHRAPCPIGLRRQEHEIPTDTLQRRNDAERSGLKARVPPAKGEKLPSAQAG